MEKYFPFNSVNKDRVCDATDIARYISQYFTNGIFNNGLKVKSNNNMTVNVSVGSANINGYEYSLLDEEKTLDISTPDSTLSRIDSVIVRLDKSNRQITVQILEGSYATEPSQPTLVRNNNIYDLRLANILVSTGTTRITEDLITDTRFTSDCGNVVQAVQSLDTSNIFSQYQTAWDNWFKTVQDTLDENVAGNLQNQINTINTNIDNINGIFYNEEGEWELDEDYE